ncbi:MAG: hypothetical protein ABW007_27320 [Chitinophagaceae bacterium]
MDKGVRVIGWKSYAVAALSIIAGAVAISLGLWVDGVKAIIFGLALISLRDALAKHMRLTDENRRALDNLRGAVDGLYGARKPPRV